MAGKSKVHKSKVEGLLEEQVEGKAEKVRTTRADAQRNLESLLEAAKEVFAVSGVDAPVREIAEKAGVGLGTVYRHFPQRSDLIAAVFKHEVDACATAAVTLASTNDPGLALEKWLHRYAQFIATKRGLAPALHSGDTAYKNLRAYFEEHLRPAFTTLLNTAAAAGHIRKDVIADDILYAVAHLSMPTYEGTTDHAQRMVALLIDGLRFGATDPLPSHADQ